MASKNLYYAVYGSNALGVFKDVRLVDTLSRYFINFGCKLFDRYVDARDYAIEQYNSYQTDTYSRAFKEDIHRSNYMFKRKELVKKHRRYIVGINTYVGPRWFTSFRITSAVDNKFETKR